MRPSSSTQATSPTARSSASHAARCAGVTWALATHTVTPRPMAAGVFGIERTTAVPLGRCFSKPAMVRPAAMDSTTVPLPASFASGGNTSSITCGLTATTITAGGCGNDATAALRDDTVLAEQLLAARRRRGVLHDDLLGIEATLEPPRQHRQPHIASTRQQQRSVDLQSHWYTLVTRH